MANRYEKIDQIFNINDHVDICCVTICGCKWNNEYDVEIRYYENKQYIKTVCEKEHVVCKRVSTINKRLAAKGLKCRMI